MSIGLDIAAALGKLKARIHRDFDSPALSNPASSVFPRCSSTSAALAVVPFDVPSIEELQSGCAALVGDEPLLDAREFVLRSLGQESRPIEFLRSCRNLGHEVPTGLGGEKNACSSKESLRATGSASAARRASSLILANWAIARFKLIWQELYFMFLEGRIPDYKILESARNDLIELSTADSAGKSLPALEPDVISSVDQLISALRNPDYSIDRLASLYFRLTPFLELALADSTRTISDALRAENVLSRTPEPKLADA